MTRVTSRPEDFVQVRRRVLSKLVGKLTYPSHCQHAKGSSPTGDSSACIGCHYIWEKRAMEVRVSLLALCKYDSNVKRVIGQQPKRK